MKEQLTSELVESLFAEIERAWMDRRDRTIVYKLADLHPDFRDELYEFYEDLVLGASDVSPDDSGTADARVADWLRTTGFSIARAAAAEAQARASTTVAPGSLSEADAQAPRSDSSPKATPADSSPKKDEPWLAFVKRRTGQGLPGLAQSLTNATPEFVVLVSRHPRIVPPGVKRELARQVEEVWGVSAHESLTCLESEPRLIRAASRRTAFEQEPSTFDELLNRSHLTNAQKQAWLSFQD
jgi:hypothetical protein